MKQRRLLSCGLAALAILLLASLSCEATAVRGSTVKQSNMLAPADFLVSSEDHLPGFDQLKTSPTQHKTIRTMIYLSGLTKDELEPAIAATKAAMKAACKIGDSSSGSVGSDGAPSAPPTVSVVDETPAGGSSTPEERTLACNIRHITKPSLVASCVDTIKASMRDPAALKAAMLKVLTKGGRPSALSSVSVPNPPVVTTEKVSGAAELAGAAASAFGGASDQLKAIVDKFKEGMENATTHRKDKDQVAHEKALAATKGTETPEERKAALEQLRETVANDTALVQRRRATLAEAEANLTKSEAALKAVYGRIEEIKANEASGEWKTIEQEAKKKNAEDKAEELEALKKTLKQVDQGRALVEKLVQPSAEDAGSAGSAGRRRRRRR